MSDQHLDVVAVAPHPDDLEILCGGTLAKLVKQGYKVGVIDLTSGEPTPRGTLEKRKQEAEAARHALGVHVRVNLDLPNRILMDGPEARYALATQLRKFQPKILIAGAGRTPAASPDHHQGHLIAEASRFHSQLTKWDDRYGGESPYRVPHLVYALYPTDAEHRHWHSTFVIDITDTFEQKLKAIEVYESQFDAARFAKVKHFISAHAAVQGGRCGFEYGEMFALPHPVGGQDLVSIVSGANVPLGAVVLDPPSRQIPGQDHLPMS